MTPQVRISDHSYTTGWRTKYHLTARVLEPVDFDPDGETEAALIYEVLSQMVGTRDGLVDAGPDTPFRYHVVGTTFTLEALVERVDALPTEVETIREERERERRVAALRESYPTLRGVPFDPEDVEEAIDQAAETGERVSVTSHTTECDDWEKECNTDLVTYYATPDGAIDTERTHTF